MFVISEEKERTSEGLVKWLCKCDCGVFKVLVGRDLKRGSTKSCGCIHKERNTTHGLRGHPLYNVYSGIKKRCYNTKDKYYIDYGGRGITVCNDWLGGFINFYNDMIEGYKKGLQIDRINNDSGYSKENCRWVTPQQNQMNKRPRKGSSSKYKGVFWHKRDKKWVSQLRKNGKIISLGYFIKEKDAALAYNKKALELFGEFSNINKIED